MWNEGGKDGKGMSESRDLKRQKEKGTERLIVALIPPSQNFFLL